MIAYQNRNLNVDFGYNLWARTRETINLRSCLPKKTFGLKGIQNVATMSGLSNATQRCATLHGDQFDDQAMLTDAASPQFIETCDLDLTSAASSRAITNKFFFYIGYSWDEDYHLAVVPFLGFGAEIEFEGVRPKEVQPNKNSLGQWGVWLKFGFAL